jgi:large subunit ribosomal protein L3
MTRIFTDAGEHVPVTVLKLDNCQVVAQRTEEKNGYTAVQLGAGLPRSRTSRRLRAASSLVAKVEPKRRSPSSASADNLIDVGAELRPDHFVAGQFVDVTGTRSVRVLPVA